MAEFVAESSDALDAVDAGLLALEVDPSNLELVREIFRHLHTVKGTSGSLGLAEMERLGHAGENVLGMVRDGELQTSQQLASVLLETVDALRAMLGYVERGELCPPASAALLARLEAFRDGTAPSADEPDVSIARNLIGGILAASGIATEQQITEALIDQSKGDTRRLGDILVAKGISTADNINNAIATSVKDLGAALPPGTALDSSIRIDLEMLDGIVSTVGELVLTRNQLVQAVHDGNTQAITRRTNELAYITSDLQERALRTRMQPIEGAWRNLPRVVRDASKVTAKKVELITRGEGIELDRTIIDAIRDPLVHLVRNAIDHGLETPAQRIEAGKPEVGTLLLAASQQGGHVVVEVTDDGKGIDPVAIGRAAVAKGLVREDQLAAMSTQEITDLIMAPGFSTAASVTTISGRGVGMDVVASNVQAVHGAFEIQSRLGHGTTFRLTIPLTLAIVPALVVGCRSQTFAIPQASVLELVRLKADDMESEMDIIQGARVLRLREHLLPLVDLDDLLGLTGPDDRASITVVVAQSGDQPYGIVVDHVTKAEEIVVKAVSPEVQEAGFYAGATVMGDGSPALILDLASISRKCIRGSGLELDRRAMSDRSTEKETMAVLVSQVGSIRVGVRSSDVERLEKIDGGSVEFSGTKALVQYRDRLLPLVFLNTLVDPTHPAAGTSFDGRSLRVIITSERREKSVGLVVDRVHDVLQAVVDDIDTETSERGRFVEGSVVLDGLVTELLDVSALLAESGAHGADHTSSSTPLLAASTQGR